MITNKPLYETIIDSYLEKLNSEDCTTDFRDNFLGETMHNLRMQNKAFFDYLEKCGFDVIAFLKAYSHYPQQIVDNIINQIKGLK